MLISILVILLLSVVLTGCTFACYDFSNHEVRKIQKEKYNFKVNGYSTLETETIFLVNTADQIDLQDGKIMPGASGKIEIELDTDLQKDVKYTIEIKENGNKPSNLVFCVNQKGILGTKQYTSLEELAKAELTDVIAKSDSTENDLEIIWNWPYETGDCDETRVPKDEEDATIGFGKVVGQENVFDYSFSLKVKNVQANDIT